MSSQWEQSSIYWRRDKETIQINIIIAVGWGRYRNTLLDHTISIPCCDQMKLHEILSEYRCNSQVFLIESSARNEIWPFHPLCSLPSMVVIACKQYSISSSVQSERLAFTRQWKSVSMKGFLHNKSDLLLLSKRLYSTSSQMVRKQKKVHLKSDNNFPIFLWCLHWLIISAGQ